MSNTRESWHRKMMACICACSGYVAVIVDGVRFRCKPNTTGSVNLYKGKSTRQYPAHPSIDEWCDWAAQYGTEEL